MTDTYPSRTFDYVNNVPYSLYFGLTIAADNYPNDENAIRFYYDKTPDTTGGRKGKRMKRRTMKRRSAKRAAKKSRRKGRKSARKSRRKGRR